MQKKHKNRGPPPRFPHNTKYPAQNNLKINVHLWVVQTKVRSKRFWRRHANFLLATEAVLKILVDLETSLSQFRDRKNKNFRGKNFTQRDLTKASNLLKLILLKERKNNFFTVWHFLLQSYPIKHPASC